MARGKNKLRKGERQAAKLPIPSSSNSSSSANNTSTIVNGPLTKTSDGSSGKGASHEPDDGHEYENCDHSNLSLLNMRKVARLITQLFSASFEVAVPSLFKGMIQNLQDQVLKDKIMSFVEHGLTPEQIRYASCEPATRKGIRSQIRLACEEELGDVVLRLSTEDCFDLLCDLAVRHGRDLKLLGPPCACSFSKCLPCLERLVGSVKQDPAMPPKPDSDSTVAEGKAKAALKDADKSSIDPGVEKRSLVGWLSSINFQPKPIKPKSLFDWIEDLIDNEWVEGIEWESSAWKSTITEAWQSMADTLWSCAKDIDPTQLDAVKVVHQALTEFNGLDLYYAVVTREIATLKGTSKDGLSGRTSKGGEDGKSVTVNGSGAGGGARAADKVNSEGWMNEKFSDSETFAFTMHFEKLRRETLKIMQDTLQEKAKELRKAGKTPQGKKPASSSAGSAVANGIAALATTPLAGALLSKEWSGRDDYGESHRKALARAVREQGNAAYAAGEYVEATEHYTRAIGYDSTEAIFPLNRAACLLKLKKFSEAEMDCSAALALDPSNHKAYFRRGVSRAALLKVDAAKSDFDKVLSLQDSNPEARDGLKKLSEHFLTEARRREAKGKGESIKPEIASMVAEDVSDISLEGKKPANAGKESSTKKAPTSKISTRELAKKAISGNTLTHASSLVAEYTAFRSSRLSAAAAAAAKAAQQAADAKAAQQSARELDVQMAAYEKEMKAKGEQSTIQEQEVVGGDSQAPSTLDLYLSQVDPKKFREKLKKTAEEIRRFKKLPSDSPAAKMIQRILAEEDGDAAVVRDKRPAGRSAQDDQDDEEEDEEDEGDYESEGGDERDEEGWTDTDATSSPSAGDGKAQLEVTPASAEPTSFRSVEEVRAKQQQLAEEDAFERDAMNVAQQVAFAFIFGQIVKQRTGVDVPRQMGFLTRPESAKGSAAPATGEGKAASPAASNSPAKSKSHSASPSSTAKPSANKTAGSAATASQKKEAREGPFNLTRSDAVEMVESFFAMHHTTSSRATSGAG